MDTLERWLRNLAAATLLIGPICAQTAERQATLTGGGGNDAGKCTIEVYVDGSADVEIRGDRGFLRTLSGQPAQWRRFECSGPMPANPVEFRFSGVDGRGKQELLQDPSRGRGGAVVRIQDSSGGAEGYTFDLVWRGAGFVPGPTGQPLGGTNRGGSPNSGARACKDAVRERANLQYGFRDIDFKGMDGEENPGRNDKVEGSFDVPRGNSRDTYHFSCSVDSANGRVRGVEISRGRDTTGADRYAGRDNAISACQRAAEQQIQRDGYRNVQFGSMDANSRQRDWISGTATAQRGNSERAYDFDIGCTVNPDNGNVRSVQARRQ
ncbi:MAG TPA: hypothetical protein VKU19_26720 [Bryobacteraceae bacterium]|nr:hypothetical protein [Bryobacteraceae bacterium]